MHNLKQNRYLIKLNTQYVYKESILLSDWMQIRKKYESFKLSAVASKMDKSDKQSPSVYRYLERVLNLDSWFATNLCLQIFIGDCIVPEYISYSHNKDKRKSKLASLEK